MYNVQREAYLEVIVVTQIPGSDSFDFTLFS